MKKILVAVLMSLVLVVSGCSFTDWLVKNKATLQLVIDIAIGAMVDKHPANSAVIGKAASDVIKVVNDTEKISMADFSTFFLNKIDRTTLSPMDQNVVKDLVAILDSNLQTYFEKQGVSLDKIKDQTVPVQEIATMVLHALGSPEMNQRIMKLNAKKPEVK